jgi:hypothetical protein
MSGVPQFRKRPPTREAVREILRLEWDPINLQRDGPEDEYDPYVDPVHAMVLDRTKTADDIATYLFKVETETMALNGNAELQMQHSRKIATKLLLFRNTTG